MDEDINIGRNVRINSASAIKLIDILKYNLTIINLFDKAFDNKVIIYLFFNSLSFNDSLIWNSIDLPIIKKKFESILKQFDSIKHIVKSVAIVPSGE